MIRILIADDQSLIRDGLKTVLDMEEGLTVVGTARDGYETLSGVLQLDPDVVLLDMRMPGMNGADCVKRIRESGSAAKVLILTTFDDEEYILSALAGGANGYLLKDLEMGKLVEAIRDAVQGKMILPQKVASRLAEGLNRLQNKRQEEIRAAALNMTEREMEIASMLVQGFSNRQIAAALYISEGTVRNYISGLYAKIGINDRVQAVLFLREHGVR
ncbi:MAG: response regulator transcription factor [Clostridiaceae bacterium]|nr:response regulator transcription factor [Clostridiaceae bacterium]